MGCDFQRLGVLLIWIIVWQGPTALAAGADGVAGIFFSRLSSFSPSVWEIARYRVIAVGKGH